MLLRRIFFVLVLGLVIFAQGNFHAQNADKDFTVTIYNVGNGSGLVVSSPPGIDCGAGFNKCSARFDRGTPVTLSPRTLHGPTVFRGWSVVVGSTVQCDGSPDRCSFILLENSSAQAEFVLD